ncbi:MAG: type II CAAX endopeptidase family protein [Patescibacteria group bacterium]
MSNASSSRLTHRTSLPTSTAGRTAGALGKSRRYRLRFSLNVLHIRFTPILAGVLRFTQVRNPASKVNNKKPEQNNKNHQDFGGPSRVILLVFAIFLLSQFVAALLLKIAYGIIHPGADNILDQSVGAQFFYILLAEALAVGCVIWVLRRRQLGLGAIGFSRRPAWRDVKWAGLGFVIFYGILVAVTAILTLLIPGFDSGAPQDVGFNVLSTPLDQIIALIALVILPPLGEEILIRGYLYSGLRSRWAFWPAMLITSLLFGVAHLSTGANGTLWAAGVDTFILSAILVYLRERSGALYAPIMMHAANNLIAFVAHFHG